MAKERVTFSCGHTEIIYLYGKTKDRERKIAWYEKNRLCSACREVDIETAREMEFEAAKERADEWGLPGLIGSEKQVSWATRIRDKFIAEGQNFLDKADRSQRDESISTKFLDALLSGNLEHEDAGWWIDNRDSKLLNIRNAAFETSPLIPTYFGLAAGASLEGSDYLKMDDAELYRLIEALLRGERPVREKSAVTKDEVAALAEIKAERVLRPVPENEKPGMAEIRKVEKHDSETITVEVHTPMFNKTVKDLAKKMGYKWNRGCWSNTYAVGDNSINNRVVELAVTLLDQGYAVQLPDAETTERAKNADYKPFNSRTIKSLAKDGKFIIRWGLDDDNFYEVAKRLPGSKWNKKLCGIIVPASSFDEVLDFADAYNFEVSEGARNLAVEAEIIKVKALISDAKPVRLDKPKPQTVPKKLEISEEIVIDASLRDDD